MFGIALLSSFSSQPSSIIRRGRPDESVMTMRSRPIDWPCESGPSIFPKNASLSLMSSTYLTLTPYFFVNCVERRVRFVFLLLSM